MGFGSGTGTGTNIGERYTPEVLKDLGAIKINSESYEIMLDNLSSHSSKGRAQKIKGVWNESEKEFRFKKYSSPGNISLLHKGGKGRYIFFTKDVPEKTKKSLMRLI